MSRWFRHYAGMMRDEKLVAIAVKSKQPVERVLWVWGAILESATEINDNGRYELDAAEVAYFLRADEADICAVLAGLESAARLADHRVVRWCDRQFSSDKSKDRQAAYRERQRQKGSHGHDQAGVSDGDITSRDGEVTAQDTDTDTELLEPKGSCASRDALKPEHVKEKWNEVAARLWGSRTIRELTPTRRQSVRARIAQYDLSDFVTVFGKIEASGFLRGDTGWRGCSFDWVMKRQNFQKIIEGNYDE